MGTRKNTCPFFLATIYFLVPATQAKFLDTYKSLRCHDKHRATLASLTDLYLSLEIWCLWTSSFFLEYDKRRARQAWNNENKNYFWSSDIALTLKATNKFSFSYRHTNSPNWSPNISLQNELFDKRSKHFPFGDHFIYSYNLISWQCMGIIRRKLMLVTFGTSGLKI